MSYAQLEQHFRRIGHLGHLAAILQWDEAVMMPPGSGDERAAATASLNVVQHELMTDPRLPQLVDAARGEAQRGNLEPGQSANLREIERLVKRAQATPAALVERLSVAQLRCEQAWRSLRAQNDFASFAPLLSEVLSLKRELATVLAEALSLSPYEALMDEFEPGLRVSELDALFAELKSFLPGLIDQVIDAQRGEALIVPEGPFPIAAQRALGEALMQAIGFDVSRGRLDVSHHPFCGGAPSDVRITTRYDERSFTQSLLGVLHEAGHAKYEQGLPRSWAGQPVGSARGMSMHESQSLLSEMQVSRGLPFLRFLAPQLARAFPEAYQREPRAFSADNLYRLFTRVKRSKIRVDADEVTYPCHILLRYDLERALIDGRMRVDDLPDAWDAGMRELLQVSTGADHRDGCMQDVHWPSGAFGYFPTYTLGAMTAAQLYACARRELPGLEAEIEAGRFESLNTFLRERIWSRASLLGARELLQQASGEALDPRYFAAHLRARYLGT
ncbi:MAG TPA: carboxypeptidase M32 [Polyangiales bacterium]